MPRTEVYNHISKSAQDTIIKGVPYRSSIQVNTDEDFFGDRISLPELIEKYTDFQPEHVIIYWHSTKYRYTYEDDIGTIIRNYFPLFSFKYSAIQL